MGHVFGSLYSILFLFIRFWFVFCLTCFGRSNLGLSDDVACVGAPMCFFSVVYHTVAWISTYSFDWFTL